MKIIYILSVAVLLWEYLAITNARFRKKDLEEYFQAKRRINDATYTYVDKNQIHLGSSLKLMKNVMVRTIHQDAKTKTAEIKQLANSSKQKIKSLVKRRGFNFLKFAKMSGLELQDIKGKIAQAKMITTSSGIQYKELINITIIEMRNILETTQEDVKSFTVTNIERLEKYKDDCEAKIKMLPETEQDKGKIAAQNAVSELNKLGKTINDELDKMWKTSQNNVRKVEITSSQSAFNLTDVIISKYQAIKSSHERMKDYIKRMGDTVSKIGQNLSDKYKEMVDKCLGVVEAMVIKNQKNTLELSKEYGILLISISGGDKKEEKIHNDIIAKINDQFEKSNKYLSDNFFEVLGSTSDKVWSTISTMVVTIKAK